MSRKTKRAHQPEQLPVAGQHDQALGKNTDALMRLTKVAAVASAGLIAALPSARHQVTGFVHDAADSLTMPGTPNENNPSPEQLQTEAQETGKFTVQIDPSDPTRRIVRYHTGSDYATEGGIIETIAPGQDRVLAMKAFEVGNSPQIAPNSEISLVLGEDGDILPVQAPPEESSSQTAG